MGKACSAFSRSPARWDSWPDPWWEGFSWPSPVPMGGPRTKRSSPRWDWRSLGLRLDRSPCCGVWRLCDQRLRPENKDQRPKTKEDQRPKKTKDQRPKTEGFSILPFGLWSLVFGLRLRLLLPNATRRRGPNVANRQDLH